MKYSIFFVLVIVLSVALANAAPEAEAAAFERGFEGERGRFGGERGHFEGERGRFEGGRGQFEGGRGRFEGGR